MSKIRLSFEDVEKYIPLVKRIASRLKKKLPNSVLINDLVQDGCIGLLNALDKYDPSQGASFETYAGIRIRGTMLDGLRLSTIQPKAIRRNAREIKEAVRLVESRTKREARPKETAKELGISISELSEMILACERNIQIPEASFGDFGIEDCALEDPDPEHLKSQEELLHKEQLSSILKSAIKQIPEREQLVFGLYFEEELNLREIGVIFGVSESRVSQLLSQAIIKIKSRLEHEYNITAA